MMCSNCAGDYENPGERDDVAEEVVLATELHKRIEARKPWRHSTRGIPKTYFDSYHSRLYALAHRHGVPPASLKALIEDAFGKPDTPPAEQESKQALLKLAKMKVGPCELNWLFQFSIVPEGL